MHKAAHNFERFTISLPLGLSKGLEEIKNELHVSKSELFKMAFERFLEEYRKKKLAETARMMAVEYKTNKELIALTELDGEDFK